jgi:hypothetical protein
MSDADLSTYVQQLVDDQVEEGLSLDYKGGCYRLSETDCKASLAKDVTGFANTEGGAILLGVRERRVGGKTTRRPDPDYGISEQPDYGARLSQVLASAVSPMLPDLRVCWVPKAGAPTKGVYLIWHPRSWLRPHMVHSFSEFRYYRRDADRTEPVPMDEQAVDRLYQQRLHGEHRAEAFLSETDFSIGYKERHKASKYAYMTVCICPRLLLDRAFDFAGTTLRSWVNSEPFRVGSEVDQWKPASWGAFLVRENNGKFGHTAQLYSNGSLAIAARVARHLPKREDESKVSLTEIVRYLRAAYGHLAKLYSRLGAEYVELRVRVTFDDLDGCWLEFPSDLAGDGRVVPVTAAHHVLDEGVNVATIIADPEEAIKPMLDHIWRTFELGWRMPPQLIGRLDA